MAEAEPAPTSTTTEQKVEEDDKVIIKFKAAGGAPQLVPEKKKLKCPSHYLFKVA